MTLAERLQEKLSSWAPAGDGRHSRHESFADLGWSVGIAADHTDVVGGLIWEMTLERTSIAPDGLTQRTWADRIVASATGLMEHLKVLEVDASQHEALLRSDTPTAKGDAVHYYEIVLHGLTRAVVRRFKANRAGGTREQLAFAMTHESLAKLAGDIAG